jgi:hypothetical protein
MDLEVVPSLVLGISFIPTVTGTMEVAFGEDLGL